MRKVKVTCYGLTEVFESAEKAIVHFTEGMLYCDPNSSEYARYAIIVEKLQSGQIDVDDNY